MYYLILTSSFLFVIFFVWYLIADSSSARRISGLMAILASLLTCGLAIYPIDKTIHLGLDLQGGTEFLLQVQGNPTSQALEEAAGVIRKRLDAIGTREISIQPENENRIKIQIPGLKGDEIAAVRGDISRVAKLEFRLVPENAAEILARAQANQGKLSFEDAQNYEILPQPEKDSTGKVTTRQVVLNRQAEFSGKHVTSAYRGVSEFGQPVVDFQLDGAGTEAMAQLSRNNQGRKMAIVLDKEVRSVASLPSEPDTLITTGSVQIHGSMTDLDCEELASVLQNPLENAIKILDENSVDASLGADSISSGWHAGLIALALVVTFMVFYYRLSGVFAVIALAVNLVLLLGLLAQLHFTLTLPGIAGIVLTIGMAVDANVLIYERIRDELALGKPASAAIDTGFERAFSAIFDSNVTTLIPAVVLACLGTGPLRGFAVTLVLGIVANLFAALVVSRNAFDWTLSVWPKPNLSMFQIIKSPRFNFLAYRHIGLVLSLIVLLAGGLAVAYKGQSLLGVDFKGGDSVTLTYSQQKVDVGLLRADLLKNGLKDVVLQYASNSPALFVETEEQAGERAAAILKNDFPQAGFTTGAISKVGAQVGGEMKQRALVALLAGLFGILVYAAIRFELSYAVAAAVGQLHDVLIALSIMALYGSELTLPLVGALLTIAGYSINDKIVVFDRIREGVRLREKGNLGEVMNRSLNLTLARTIITGFTCLLATAALIFFGGPVIHDFSLAMFIGILSGIYSSHFISPGIAWWLDRHHAQSAPTSSGVLPVKKLPVNV